MNRGDYASIVAVSVLTIAVAIIIAEMHAPELPDTYEASVFNKTDDGRAINVAVTMDGEPVCGGSIGWLDMQVYACEDVEDIEVDGEEHNWYVVAKYHDGSTEAQMFTTSVDKLMFLVHDDSITMKVGS